MSTIFTAQVTCDGCGCVISHLGEGTLTAKAVTFTRSITNINVRLKRGVTLEKRGAPDQHYCAHCADIPVISVPSAKF